MTTYKSKISPGIYISIAVLPSAVACFMIAVNFWPNVILIVLIAAFIAHMTLTTYYQVDGTNLIIKCGFFYSSNVNITTIRKIRETRNPLSAPATSLDRLEIMYNKYDVVMISPKEKQAFIQQLTNLNPAIEVQLKKR
jgi:hypothetical protein